VHAERAGLPLGVVAAHLRGVTRGHHDRPHPLRAERVHRHREREGGIDAAGQPEHHAGEMVLVHVVGDAEHERPVDPVDELGRRRDVRGEDVPAGLDLDELQRLDEERRAIHQFALAAHGHGAAVEDQLVLAAGDVHVDDRQAGLGIALAQHRLAPGELARVVGRAVDRQQHLRPRGGRAARRLGTPEVLADGDAELDALHLHHAGLRARLEVALLVEHAVVRQGLLAVDDGRAVRPQQDGAVVDGVAVVLGIADEDGHAVQALAEALERLGDVAREAAVEQQVLGRIAAQRELREHDEVRAQGVVRAPAELQHVRDVGLDVADDGVGLGDGDSRRREIAAFQRTPHIVESLRVVDREVRRPPCLVLDELDVHLGNVTPHVYQLDLLTLCHRVSPESLGSNDRDQGDNP
jgi:hypothetical protein